MLNDILWRAIKRAQIPAVKEPTGLSRTDGKRPDGATLLPWAKGKPLAWDVTVPDTYADSHIAQSATTPCATADQAANKKTAKYQHLASTHLFFPVAIETSGAYNNLAIELIQEIGKSTALVTLDQRESMYLFQRLSIAIQRGGAVSLAGTFESI